MHKIADGCRLGLVPCKWRYSLASVSAALVSAFTLQAAYAQETTIGKFSEGDLSGWKPREFVGKTEYELTATGGETVLEANSNSSASGLVKTQYIDLLKTPMLVWRWKIAQILESDLGERTKEGDDFAVRIYFVTPGSGLFSYPDSVTYVWSSQQPEGSMWANPYTNKVRMMAVDSGPDFAGTWRTHRRNMREDFKILFGRDITKVSHIAIMTDTDNTGSSARSWYGDITVEAVP